MAWGRVINEEPNCALAALVDIRLDRACEKAASWGQTEVPCFADLSDALEATECDALVLATPPECHAPQGVIAFERRCHVLCEQPLSEDLGKAIEFVKQADRHSRHLMVGMNYRYMPVNRALRALFGEAKFGVLGYGHFTHLRHRDGRRPKLNKYLLTIGPADVPRTIGSSSGLDAVPLPDRSGIARG
jgi:predicted dehydrogenase